MEEKQTKRFPYFKIFLGLLCVLAVVLIALMLERTIGSSVKDVVIDKAKVTDGAYFKNVRPLSTKIITVRASDGSYRLAFDDCLSCYYNDGVRAHFSDTGESLVCDNCGCETFYDDLGLISDECTPIPILAEYITSDDETITVPKAFLERCKEMLDVLRIGKGNYANIYTGADYRNMEITEASDVAVSYDDDDGGEAAEGADGPVDVDELRLRTEEITKLYQGYLNDVTLNASQSDIGVYGACYREFLGLCDELAETDVSDTRARAISEKFDEIEAKMREIGKASAR